VEQLLDKGVNPDQIKYLQCLYYSAASLLGFSKYITKTGHDLVRSYENKNLSGYFSDEGAE
jgi:hypothetical protein